MEHSFLNLSDAQLASSLSSPAESRVCSSPVVPLQFNTLATSAGNEAVQTPAVGVVYDAVMELHLREGELHVIACLDLCKR